MAGQTGSAPLGADGIPVGAQGRPLCATAFAGSLQPGGRWVFDQERKTTRQDHLEDWVVLRHPSVFGHRTGVGYVRKPFSGCHLCRLITRDAHLGPDDRLVSRPLRTFGHLLYDTGRILGASEDVDYVHVKIVRKIFDLPMI